jgi:hypothetical protein
MHVADKKTLKKDSSKEDSLMVKGELSRTCFPVWLVHIVQSLSNFYWCMKYVVFFLNPEGPEPRHESTKDYVLIKNELFGNLYC